jgi:hypothetical protein
MEGEGVLWRDIVHILKGRPGNAKGTGIDIYTIHINTLNPELNPICYLLALLGAHHFLHVSRIRVKIINP